MTFGWLLQWHICGDWISWKRDLCGHFVCICTHVFILRSWQLGKDRVSVRKRFQSSQCILQHTPCLMLRAMINASMQPKWLHLNVVTSATFSFLSGCFQFSNDKNMTPSSPSHVVSCPLYTSWWQRFGLSDNSIIRSSFNILFHWCMFVSSFILDFWVTFLLFCCFAWVFVCFIVCFLVTESVLWLAANSWAQVILLSNRDYSVLNSLRYLLHV